MKSKIIDQSEFNLKDSSIKILKSAWGVDAINETNVSKITYLSDGLKVKAYLAHPKDTSQSYPCIIWCRGGFGDAGTIDEFNARGIFGQLASWGYVVFAPQYRGNMGGEGHDEFGGGDINDVLNILPLAEELNFADENNWGIEGWSRGGMMTYLALTKTDIFKAAVVIGGITDLNYKSEDNDFILKVYKKKFENHTASQIKANFDKRSIMNFSSKISKSTPLMILHGTSDDKVLPLHSLRLAEKLQQENYDYKLVMLEKGDHFLKNHRNEVNLLRKSWYQKLLK